MKIIQKKTIKEMRAPSETTRKRQTKTNPKTKTNMSAGRRRYVGYSLQAHELL